MFEASTAADDLRSRMAEFAADLLNGIQARAEDALGPEFDIEAFHDTLLGSGSVPMPTMCRLIDEWVAAQ